MLVSTSWSHWPTNVLFLTLWLQCQVSMNRYDDMISYDKKLFKNIYIYIFEINTEEHVFILNFLSNKE